MLNYYAPNRTESLRIQTFIQSIARFFQRGGEIHFHDAFLSPRLVKEALEIRFRLVTVQETSTHLRLKIIRLFRLYGGPMIWPQAQIDITLRKDDNAYTLYWYFYWPEYYSLLLWPVLFGLVALTEPRLPLSLSMLPIATLFSGFLIFLDTIWVARTARRAFQRL